MFKTQSISLAILLLTEKASASKINQKNVQQQAYRPPAGSVPWTKPATRPTWVDDDGDEDVPRNYFIPNFGAYDQDMLDVQQSLSIAAKGKQPWVITDENLKQKSPPKDYTVQNLGQDVDISVAQQNIEEAEKVLNHTWLAPQNDGQYWAVQNEGAPIDHSDNLNWYFDPAPQYVQTDAQIQLGSDPICASAGCDQYMHPDSKFENWPQNYPVPNFGMDRNIQNSLSAIPIAEKLVGAKWNWDGKAYKQNKGPVYNIDLPIEGDLQTSIDNMNAAETARSADSLNEWNAIQLGASQAAFDKSSDHPIDQLVQLNSQTESDPICASAGCDQYMHPDSKIETWPLNYPVPSFGMDRHIQDSLLNIGVAEKIVGHKWTWAGKELARKAKDTNYNFNPDLDEDMVVSQKNLSTAETELNHVYELS